MIEILHSVSIMNRGGQETLLMNLMRNIDRSNIHFSFLCSSEARDVEGDYDEEIRELGGVIYYLDENLLSKIKILKRVGEVFQIRNFFLKHHEFNIFHIHSCHAFYALPLFWGAKIAGVNTIIIHSHNTLGPRPWLHKLTRPFLNMFQFERFACSIDAAKWYFGKRYNESVIIKNGIILDNFRYDAESRKKYQKEFNLSDSNLVVGHVGRFNIQKNHKLILKVFQQLVQKNTNARLILVGTGELKKQIEEYAVELGISSEVIFTGVRNDVDKLMSFFDVFFFPSLFEGLGIVVIEAQASGLPCIISDVIPSDVDLTGCILRLSLHDEPSKWSDAIQNCKKDKSDTINTIREKGYDIIDSTTYLTEKYRSFNLRIYHV